MSPDGSRAVWIQGEAHDAFLYDRTFDGNGNPTFEPKWLEDDVASVDWYNDASGSLASIVLTRFDGGVDNFDPNGERFPDSDAAPEAPAAPSVKRDLGKAFEKSGAFQALGQGKISW